MIKHYILDGTTPKPVELLEWAKWFENADRAVAKTSVSNEVTVSTVFLGLDHSFTGGDPLLFETMIFGGKHDEYCERYGTWEEAVGGHERAVALAKK